LSEKLQPMEVHAIALGEETGKGKFYSTSFNPQNSLLKPVHEGVAPVTAEIEVQVRTLDEFCRENAIEHVDILKLDIQGGELMALRGAQKLLGIGAIDLVFLEVSFTESYEGSALFFDVYRFLHEAGFVLFGIYNCLYGKRNLAVIEGDAVFVRKGFMESAGLK
jgi:FkbM family methyltransferase